LGLGLSMRNAVLVIYGITLGLCLLAIAIVNLHDEIAGLLLVILGVGAFMAIRKLGYFDYIDSENVLGWFKDLSDEAGLPSSRRTFLSMQIEIISSKSVEDLWSNMDCAMEMLEFDISKVYLNFSWVGAIPPKVPKKSKNKSNRRKIHLSKASASMRQVQPDWYWSTVSSADETQINSRNLLRIELPLINATGTNLGVLVLLKNMREIPLSRHTLRRVEHLRRTLTDTLERMQQED